MMISFFFSLRLLELHAGEDHVDPAVARAPLGASRCVAIGFSAP